MDGKITISKKKKKRWKHFKYIEKKANDET